MVMLERPLRVRASLLSGGTFAGTLERWDGEALYGSFGRHAWHELKAADLKRLFTQVMDRRNGAHCLTLAELLASSPDGAAMAEDAFRQARVAGCTPEQLDGARARARVAQEARARHQAQERERQMKRGHQGASTPTTWPVLSPEERQTALEEVRQRAGRALEVTGQPQDRDPLESARFILCGNLPVEEQRRLLDDLEQCCSRSLEALGQPPASNPFHGKGLVLVLPDRDAFKVAQVALFNAGSASEQQGALHTAGPEVTILCWKGSRERVFHVDLMRQVALGVLYRTISDGALPPWAAEGFALCMARSPERRTHVDEQWRSAGLRFLRQGGSAAQVMAATLEDGTWPGPEGIGYSVGYLLVDLMLGEAPQRFAPWIQVVKKGTPWPQALRESYGTDPAGLAAAAAAWYRTNDGAPRR